MVDFKDVEYLFNKWLEQAKEGKCDNKKYYQLLTSLEASQVYLSTKKIREKFIKFDKLMVDYKSSTIVSNAAVGAFIADNQRFIPLAQEHVIRMNIPTEPYLIGHYDKLKVYINPYLKFDDLRIYSLEDLNIALIDLSDEGFSTNDIF